MDEETRKMKKKLLVDYKVLELEIDEEMWDAVLYRLDTMKEKILKTPGILDKMKTGVTAETGEKLGWDEETMKRVREQILRIDKSTKQD